VPPELEVQRSSCWRIWGGRDEPPTLEPTPALRLLLKRGEAVSLGEKLFASCDAADSVLEEIKTVCQEEGGSRSRGCATGWGRAASTPRPGSSTPTPPG
jgi:hypothetical protein